MNNKKISVIIPTLQKNKKVLLTLISTLYKDNFVDEIIIIDNSLKGLEQTNEKLKIIIPQRNLYVNPSWNMGVSIAKNDIVALFNDDISIPENFCRDVVLQMNSKMGIVGVDSKDCIIASNNIDFRPQNTNPVLIKTDYMSYYFGTIMFFYKNAYNTIPDDIKIVYGDAWIFNMAQKTGKLNYRITNQILYHIGSLSSADRTFNPICKNDAKIFKKLYVKWYHRIFSIEKLWRGLKIRFFGITLLLKNQNARRWRNE